MKLPSRGQSEVLAIVLLLGLVIVSAMAVVAVGSTALSSVEDKSATEQDRNEMQSLSHGIDTMVSSDGTASPELREEYELREGANVTISTDRGEEATYNTGRLEYNGLTYEGGMIIEDHHVVSSPQLSLAQDSTMVQLPVISYGAVDGTSSDIRHVETETPLSDPARRVEISIESEYYELWYDQLREVNADVWKDDSSETVHVTYGEIERESLYLGMSDSSSFGLNSIPSTHIESYRNDDFDRHNASVELSADAKNQGAGQSHRIQGDLISEGDISRFETNDQMDVTGEILSNREITSPTPTEDLLIDADESFQNYDRGDDLRGGVFYVDGDLTLSSSDDVNVDETSVLIVEDDLRLEHAQIEVLEGAALDVHVHGNLHLEGNGDVVKTENEYRSDRVSFFVGGDTIDIEGHPVFTGLIHGTESSATVDKEALTVYGAMVLNDLGGHQQQGEFNLFYDENLEGRSPYASLNGNPPGLSDPFEHYDGNVNEGDVNFDGDVVDDDLLVEGDADAEATTVHGDLLVKGEADISATEIENVAVKEELDIEGGEVSGDLWVEDDLDLSQMTVGGDIFVDGDVDIADATIDGSVYATGEVDIERTAIHGDLISRDDVDIADEGTDGDLRVGGDLNLERADVGHEVHVVGETDFSDGNTGGSLFAADDVDLSRANIGGDLHTTGDFDCDNSSKTGELYTGEDSKVDGCTWMDPTEGTPTEPDVPADLPPDVELPDLPASQDLTHHVDVRIAHLEIDD
ncbi:DUF7289 family protein [Halomontanus rarus]|uniref:DUF7289 family protein n=1 Tax=Halomontanus rarus TaxID=3034020 RepID=UPI0023E88659|nr:hypothetical protein [Halovivax sp. TS33]